ncbi:MAG TPA: glycosyltransferase [Candidatus Obscuribacterales bacterium]
MGSFRICVCFSDTGGGHRSAAEAIEAGISEVVSRALPGEHVVINVENMAEQSHPINRAMVEFYNFLLRHCQPAMKYYAWLVEATRPNDSELGYRLARKYALEALTRMDPSVVVSVHPMTNHYLARAMRELGMAGRVKLITVVTDPNSQLWSGWACPDADLIVAPNDLARDRLLSLGIRPERIKTIGMPVHPRFLAPPEVDRRQFLAPLGLDPERLTVCITAGWAGGGNMARLYRALSGIRRSVQAVFVCGHNEELFESIEREATKSPVPTAVLPFHDSMADLMAACDLLVTKAGGLTTFEAIARRLPMAIDLLTEPMPQEAGTADILIGYGLARPLRKPSDIVSIVEDLDGPPTKLPEPLPAAHSLDRVGAVYDIARLILAQGNPAWEPLLASERSKRAFYGTEDQVPQRGRSQSWQASDSD